MWSHFLICSFLSECPEEAYDPRSLYERLQEQREKKQQEFEEQFKFSKHQRLLFWTETQQSVVCNSCMQHLTKGHICVSCLPLWEINRLQKSIIEILSFSRLVDVPAESILLWAPRQRCTRETQKLLAVTKLHSCKVWNTRLILHVKSKKTPLIPIHGKVEMSHGFVALELVL